MASKPLETIAQVLKAQGEYQREFEKAQADFRKARTTMTEKKIALTNFDEQYGRVCRLLTEGGK